MTHIPGRLFLAFALLSSLAVVLPAHAQVCSTECSNYYQGNCIEHKQTCVTPPPPKPSYGAIAYGRKSQAFGYSFQWDSQAKAESVAMQNCAKNGADCEILVWYDRKCGAVVARADSTVAYWGLGDTVGQARTTAMSQCTEAGGRQCTLKVSQCSR